MPAFWKGTNGTLAKFRRKHALQMQAHSVALTLGHQFHALLPWIILLLTIQIMSQEVMRHVQGERAGPSNAQDMQPAARLRHGGQHVQALAVHQVCDAVQEQLHGALNPCLLLVLHILQFIRPFWTCHRE